MSPATDRLPGTQPVSDGDWLRVEDSYAGQMAERRRLISERRGEVIASVDGAEEGVAELSRVVLEFLRGRGDFVVEEGLVRCPDGVVVPVDREDPLGTLGGIAQEDLCLLRKHGEVWRLDAAVLCFPAGWMLSEKIGGDLAGIHAPVREYDSDVARRVARLFDGLRPERPIWRVNALLYDEPELHQPRSERDRRDRPTGAAAYVRSERQCLKKLPESGAVVFSIHTYVTPTVALAESDRAALAEGRPRVG